MSRIPKIQLLTVGEVAQVMRVSNMTVYRLVHSGQLPAVRFGRSFRIPVTALSEMLDSPIGLEQLGEVS